MDHPRPAREPVFNLPPATLLLVAAFVIVHIARGFVSVETETRWLIDFAFLPLRFWWLVDADWAGQQLNQLAAAARGSRDPDLVYAATIARHVLAEGESKPWTALSYAFLHGDWTHLIVNCVWMAAFGSAIERRVGSLRTLFLFAAGVVAGAVFHAAIDADGLAPLIGASAGVSACFGAAARFVFLSGGPLGLIGYRGDAPFRVPAPPLSVVLRDRRSLGFILLWLLLNVITGYFAEPLGVSSSPVAWFAHIGGFLVGLLGFPLFDKPRRR